MSFLFSCIFPWFHQSQLRAPLWLFVVNQIKFAIFALILHAPRINLRFLFVAYIMIDRTASALKEYENPYLTLGKIVNFVTHLKVTTQWFEFVCCRTQVRQRYLDSARSTLYKQHCYYHYISSKPTQPSSALSSIFKVSLSPYSILCTISILVWYPVLRRRIINSIVPKTT